MTLFVRFVKGLEILVVGQFGLTIPIVRQILRWRFLCREIGAPLSLNGRHWCSDDRGGPLLRSHFQVLGDPVADADFDFLDHVAIQLQRLVR